MTIENLDEIKKAKAKIVEGSLTIWNARLDSLIRSGDIRGALGQLTSPVEFGDNCGCNSPCGADILRGELPSQLSRPASK